MVILFALLIALLSLGVSVALVVRVVQLSQALQESQHGIEESRVRPAPILDEPPARPLEGLRIGLAVTQDHPGAPFIALLKDQLFAEDVTDIETLSKDEAAKWKAREKPLDLLIAGTVVCNGYAEIYYQADLSCSSARQAICNLIEKPPHGDRPINLAMELVSRLKSELEKVVNRDERRQAIRELKD
jgi:hypothetical protein